MLISCFLHELAGMKEMVCLPRYRRLILQPFVDIRDTTRLGPLAAQLPNLSMLHISGTTVGDYSCINNYSYQTAIWHYASAAAGNRRKIRVTNLHR